MTQARTEPRSTGASRDRLLSSLFAGLVIGLIAIFMEISFASLAFSGAFAPYLGAGIGYMLVGAFAMGVVVALTSSVEGAVAVPQDTTAALLSLVAAGVAGGIASATEAAFITVVAVMVIASLLTGVCFLLLGWFRLGRLVRFIPYPVIAGFLGGTGWFLLKGSVGLLTGESLALANLGQLLQPDVVAMWLPGVAFVIALRLVLGRSKHFLAMPALILVALLLFYTIVWLSGHTLAGMAEQGWLLGPFSSSAIWRPPTPALLSSTDWKLVFDNAGTILAIVIISTVGLLMNASVLEGAIRRDVNLDTELRASGLGNLLAGLLGGPPGYQTLSLSVLGWEMGARSRLVGVVMAITCLSALFVGTDVLALLPRFVFGGLILHLGLSFLSRSLVAGWSRLPRFDYAIVLTIIVVMAVVGVLEALLVGIALTVILFVIKYSRVDVVRTEVTGACFRSRVDRSPEAEAILRANGEGILVLRLQGFVFFGTAEGLLDRVGQRVRVSPARSASAVLSAGPARSASDGPAPLRFLLLDFQAVHGVDVSALNSFVRLTHLAEAHQFQLLFCAMAPDLIRQMASMGVTATADESGEGPAHVLSDLDQAMEYGENQLLAEHDSAAGTYDESTMGQMLGAMCPDNATFEALSSAFERVEAPAATVLIRQGEQADVIYLVASGYLDVLLEAGDGSAMRVRKIGPGTVVGETGYYLNQTRGATIVASQPAVLYRLTAEALTRMESEAPVAAAVFHRFIARSLAERVVTMNALAKELQR